ncbi:MAG: MFS transporter [Erythrobacter sp.]
MACRSFKSKNILAAAVVTWSFATALCAMATGFGSLLAARMAVGIGEAGGTPPSHSIIGDYFRQSEFARALSIYSLGPVMGGVLGFAAGGLLADQIGWRATLVTLGLPGVVVGALVYFTVREPRRGRYSSPQQAMTQSSATWRLLSSNRPFVGAVIAYTMQTIIGSIVVSWTATILIRSFEATKSEAGIMLGAGAALGAMPGTLLGGWLADKLGAKDRQWMARVPAIALVVTMPFYLAAMFATSIIQMVALISLGGLFFSVATVPAIGIIQSVVAPGQRAMASAILLLCANLFGLGLGPLAAGGLSDLFEPTLGLRSLNYAVATMSLVLVPAIAAYLWTARQLKPRIFGS